MPAHPPHDDVAALPEDVLARAERWAAEDPDPAHRDTLRAELDAAAVADRGRLFGDVWRAAPAYRSLIERLPFDAAGEAP